MRHHAMLSLALALSWMVGCSGDNDSNTTTQSSSSSVLPSDSESTSSSGSSCGFLPTDSEKLAAQQQIWEAQGIDDYIFSFHFTMYSYYAVDSDFTNKVVDNVTVLSESVSSTSGYPLTMDMVFKSASGPISYDPVYGFVSGYHNNDACAYDAYRSFTVLSFEPIDENNISTEEYMIATDSKVRDMIRDTSCTQNSDCQSIAYGARACGGPETYLIYSTVNVDVTELQPLVNQYNSYAAQYNEENSLVSICSYEMPPELECYAIGCGIASGSASSPAAVN